MDGIKNKWMLLCSLARTICEWICHSNLALFAGVSGPDFVLFAGLQCKSKKFNFSKAVALRSCITYLIPTLPTLFFHSPYYYINKYQVETLNNQVKSNKGRLSAPKNL